MFWHFKKNFGQGEACPLRASQFIEMVMDSVRVMPLICKPTSPKKSIAPYLILTHPSHIFPALNQPRYQATRDHLYSPKPIKITQPCILNCLLCPALPFAQKSLWSLQVSLFPSLHFWLAKTWSLHVNLHGMTCLLLKNVCNINLSMALASYCHHCQLYRLKSWGYDNWNTIW